MPNRRNTCPKAPQAFFCSQTNIFEENPGHFLESLTLPKNTHRTKKQYTLVRYQGHFRLGKHSNGWSPSIIGFLHLQTVHFPASYLNPSKRNMSQKWNHLFPDDSRCVTFLEVTSPTLEFRITVFTTGC